MDSPPDPTHVAPPRRQCGDELLPEVYEQLRELARARLAALGPGQTLQATSLVHDAYVRLQGKNTDWDGARHFLFAAARAMHDIIVERARAKASQRRGGGRRRLELENLVLAHESPCDEILALSEALGELARADERKHRVVLLRFFGGCNVEEAASALELSPSTVEREWRFARAWLHKRLSESSVQPDADT
jgi:RNA polymerase sigma factor (TIGR02999 family)